MGVQTTRRKITVDGQPQASPWLKEQIRKGIEQIERGEFTEYTEETRKDLVADIKRRGLRRLKARRKRAKD